MPIDPRVLSACLRFILTVPPESDFVMKKVGGGGGTGYDTDYAVEFPEEALPAKITLNPESPMNDDEYYEFCMANPDLRCERTAQGEIVIAPPAGYESDYRNARIVRRLDQWAERDGRGKVSGPTAEFILPTGAALSPDAAWVSNGRIEAGGRLRVGSDGYLGGAVGYRKNQFSRKER